ncbi:MAG: acetyl-CoA carboxylase biotin carboxyl carrier protein subunit [Burkholderiaceae bacterium]
MQDKLLSDVAGTVWKIEMAVGDKVAAGDVIMILESMKMEIPVEAPGAGTIAELLVAEGESINEGQPLVRLGA